MAELTEWRNGIAEWNGIKRGMGIKRGNEDKTWNWGSNQQLLRGNGYYMTGWNERLNHLLTMNRGK